MKRGRLLWAAVMATVAITLLAGYTAAVELQLLGLLQPDLPSFLPLQVETAAPRATEAAKPLQVTVRDEGESPARGMIVRSASGICLQTTSPNQLGEYLLQLSPGRSYTLEADDGRTVTFFLEDNASVSNVTGDGWTDGEILHLDTSVRCTLQVVRNAAGSVRYTLTGNGFAKTLPLEAGDDGQSARAVFSPLDPGVYTLTGSDGTSRTIAITGMQPYISLGLD